jgi:hypothetical protein
MATDLGRKFKKIKHTCDMCKIRFEADHVIDEKIALDPIYDESWLSLTIKDRNNRHKHLRLDMCPECAEKLLELLDKHFPRLNLEDEL